MCSTALEYFFAASCAKGGLIGEERAQPDAQRYAEVAGSDLATMNTGCMHKANPESLATPAKTIQVFPIVPLGVCVCLLTFIRDLNEETKMKIKMIRFAKKNSLKRIILYLFYPKNE